LARAALNARNHVIVTGNEDEAIQRESLAGDIGAVRQQFPRARIMREVAREVGISYPRAANSEMAVTKATIQGDRATLEITSRLRRDIHGPPGHPAATIEADDYVIQYVQENGRWRISEMRWISDWDKTATPPPGITYPPLPAGTTPTATDKAGHTPLQARPRPADGPRAERTVAPGLFRMASTRPTRAFGSYSPSVAVKYSYDWVWGYNPAYVRFSNDCTNFVSQALKAGGWTETGWIKYSDGAWYYSSPEPSWTWGGAQNLFDFIQGSGRAWKIAPSIYDLWEGDVVQFKFPNDTNIHHTMIVSKVVNGNPYVNYHSGPAQDKLLMEFIRLYPGGTTYGWLLLYGW
jgi:hypothetical protein